MIEYALTIKRVSNGFVLSWIEDNEDGTERTETQVIEEIDSKDGELEAGMHLLFAVMEHFALSGSKHDPKRLTVKISTQKI
jgi:hypothetical protein